MTPNTAFAIGFMKGSFWTMLGGTVLFMGIAFFTSNVSYAWAAACCLAIALLSLLLMSLLTRDAKGDIEHFIATGGEE